VNVDVAKRYSGPMSKPVTVSVYLFAFDKFDRHGIDERDAEVAAHLLKGKYPHERFSSGIMDGILGVRIDRSTTPPKAVELDEINLVTYRAFVQGVMATRHLWER
jgi:hypothetical protein